MSFGKVSVIIEEVFVLSILRFEEINYERREKIQSEEKGSTIVNCYCCEDKINREATVIEVK